MPSEGSASERSLRARWVVLALAACFVVGAALRFYRLGSESIWFNEWLAIDHARRSFSSLLGALQTDSHPPGYFLLLKAWTLIFGTSEAAVRSLSAVAGVLGIGAIYVLARRLAGERVALLSAALIVVSPFHIYHSQDARQYTLFFLFAVLSMDAFLRILEKGTRRRYAYYASTTIGVLYLHYHAVFLVLAQAILATIHFARSGWKGPAVRRLLLAWSVGLVFLVPVGLLTAKQLAIPFHSTFWLDAPSLRTLGQAFTVFAGDDVHGGPYGVGALSVLFVIACVVAVWPHGARFWASPAQGRIVARASTVMVVWGAASVLAPFLVAVVVAPIFIDRTVIPGLAALVVLVAIGVSRLSSTTLRVALVACLLLVPLATLNEYYTRNVKEDWRGATRFVEANAARDAAVMFGASTTPFTYYGRRGDIHVLETGSVDTTPCDVAEADPDAPEVWVIRRSTRAAVLKLTDDRRCHDVVADLVTEKFSRLVVFRFRPAATSEEQR